MLSLYKICRLSDICGVAHPTREAVLFLLQPGDAYEQGCEPGASITTWRAARAPAAVGPLASPHPGCRGAPGQCCGAPGLPIAQLPWGPQPAHTLGAVETLGAVGLLACPHPGCCGDPGLPLPQEWRLTMAPSYALLERWKRK